MNKITWFQTALFYYGKGSISFCKKISRVGIIIASVKQQLCLLYFSEAEVKCGSLMQI